MIFNVVSRVTCILLKGLLKLIRLVYVHTALNTNSPCYAFKIGVKVFSMHKGNTYTLSFFSTQLLIDIAYFNKILI